MAHISDEKSKWDMTSQPLNRCMTSLTLWFLPSLLMLSQADFIFTNQSTELWVINFPAIVVITKGTFRVFL